jgi:NADH-quinone oxidoreductase subunit M
MGTSRNGQALPDLTAREYLVLGILAVLVIGIGVYPAWLTGSMQVAVADLLAHVSVAKLP